MCGVDAQLDWTTRHVNVINDNAIQCSAFIYLLSIKGIKMMKIIHDLFHKYVGLSLEFDLMCEKSFGRDEMGSEGKAILNPERPDQTRPDHGPVVRIGSRVLLI